MKLINAINKELIGNIGKGMMKGCKYLFYGAATILSCSTVADEILRSIRYSGDVSYSDTVLAIMESDMMSSYKDEMVAVLAKDRESEFYKAIIHIVNSDMMGSYKVDAVKKLCDK